MTRKNNLISYHFLNIILWAQDEWQIFRSYKFWRSMRPRIIFLICQNKYGSVKYFKSSLKIRLNQFNSGAALSLGNKCLNSKIRLYEKVIQSINNGRIDFECDGNFGKDMEHWGFTNIRCQYDLKHLRCMATYVKEMNNSIENKENW